MGTYNHDSNIEDETIVPFDDIEGGDFLSFDYLKSDGTIDTGRKVINIVRNDGEGKLHGLDIEEIQEKELVDFVQMVHSNMPDDPAEALSARLPILDIEIINTPYIFYSQNVQPFTFEIDPYKTFKITNIDNIQRFDYITELVGEIG